MKEETRFKLNTVGLFAIPIGLMLALKWPYWMHF